MTSCVFCDRMARHEYDRAELGCVVFEPLNPVVSGHLLVVPRTHSESAAADDEAHVEAGSAMQLAAKIVMEQGIEANIITSIGKGATQSVRHTHVHIVPRKAGDSLTLPWTGQLPLDPCDEWLDGYSSYKCRRPAGHEGQHGLNDLLQYAVKP